jgi:SAM-dependent methyltransferase
MHPSAFEFVQRVLPHCDVAGAFVLEIGSLDVNGSVRQEVLRYEPQEYVGLDIRPGPGVDVVHDAADLPYPDESMDLVISTETLEHVWPWREACHEMKRVCRKGGCVVLTARSKGFPYHGFPEDYWRFELDGLAFIFSDCELLKVEPDPLCPGVFLWARKPTDFSENVVTRLPKSGGAELQVCKPETER